jgi:hypothetical protein
MAEMAAEMAQPLNETADVPDPHVPDPHNNH